MARARSKVVEESESETEYVVELLKAHRRKKRGLEYRVKWEGYDQLGDDTWEPESNLTACGALIEKYWKTKEPEEQLERYKVGSKAYEELKARLDAEADGDDYEDDDEEQEQESVEPSPRQKRSDAKAKAKAAEPTKHKGRSTSPSKKRASITRAGEDDEDEQPRSRKRAKKDQAVADEEEQDNEDDKVDSGYDDDDEGRVDWEELVKTTDPGSWEDLVECVETCDKDLAQDSSPVRVLCVWKKQNPAGGPYKSWVDASIARQTCPQAVIEFFLTNLRFRLLTDEGSALVERQDDEEEEEGQQIKEEQDGVKEVVKLEVPIVPATEGSTTSVLVDVQDPVETLPPQ